jgi:hypothetical protein
MTLKEPRNYRFLSAKTLSGSSNASVITSRAGLCYRRRLGAGLASLEFPIVMPISSGAFIFSRTRILDVPTNLF